MPDLYWAIFALKDIRNTIDGDRYDVAVCHIDDTIAAISARDEQDQDNLSKVVFPVSRPNAG